MATTSRKSRTGPAGAAFSVDTQLFRELGELLVGRDSTALTELIKNAYDADATTVRVNAQALEDPERGSILVVDNGTGMTAKEFRSGYLTIAGRGKTVGDRRSSRFRRRFTGEKGIGRLAAHKLARELEVSSVADEGGGVGIRRIEATIDWDAVERYTTLDRIGEDAVSVRRLKGRERPSGTAIRLSALRHPWSTREQNAFLAELETFQPPHILSGELPKTLLDRPLIFDELTIRDVKSPRSKFNLELEGDFADREALWESVTQQIDWVVEVDSKPSGVTIMVSPTLSNEAIEDRRGVRQEVRIEAPGGGSQPRFAARILAREGSRGTRRTADFAAQISGVRIYVEGFRISPYGEDRNDWLNLDLDYARRTPKLDLNFGGMPAAPADVREGLRGLPNASYIGAVILTHEGAPDLEVLVNREGFIPSEQFDAIHTTVRAAIDLLTRIRASQGVAEGSRKAEDTTILSDELRLGSQIEDASTLVKALRASISDPSSEEAGPQARRLAGDLADMRETWERATADRSLIRVLAAVGTQLAAFVHETQGLVAAAHQVSESLESIGVENPGEREAILGVKDVVDGVAETIDAQSRYLRDTAEGTRRRRRKRHELSDRFAAASGLITPIAEQDSIAIDDQIPDDLRTVPMYAAEITVILSNLMSNAVKNAGEGGRVRISADRKPEADLGLTIRVENTGVRVPAGKGEKWFAPFASSTGTGVNPVLGQGMGLGLPITRSIVEDYGGKVHFATPLKGFATALEVELP
jgi:signal transduction histidine kinase